MEKDQKITGEGTEESQEIVLFEKGEMIILMAILLRKKLEVKDTSFHLVGKFQGKAVKLFEDKFRFSEHF